MGCTLDEITNDITGATPASFEPALDYVVVKVPRFDFAKFPAAPPVLGTTMRSVGEAMAIGRTFPEALQKALRSLETGRAGLNADPGEATLTEMDEGDLDDALTIPTPDRAFAVGEALRRGRPIEKVADASGYDPWFVHEISEIVGLRALLEASGIDPRLIVQAKRSGFSDRQLAHIWETTEEDMYELETVGGRRADFKTVDTCAAEFEAFTPYMYSTYEEEDEVPPPSAPG